MKELLKISSLVLAISVLYSCGKTKKDESEEKVTEKEVSPETISSGGNVIKLRNELFSIPSPIQTAILIRQQGLPFKPEAVAGLENVDSYLTKYKKALNLGVLGSDLAYLSNYNEAKKSLNYLAKIEDLAEQLDIKANIDPSIIKRFNDNINTPDSLNVLNAEFYKSAERYLKDNLQNEVAALVLTGGWVESLYFATQNSDNAFLRTRVGEQKSSVGNIVSIMEAFDDDLGKNIAKELRGLKSAFDKLENNYVYEKPITDKDAKKTYIKSKSSVEVNDQQLESIKVSVQRIRALIIS